MKNILKIIITFCLIFFIDNIKIYPQSKSKLLDFAEKAMKEKDYYGASQYFEKALVKDPDNIDILKNTADAHRLYNDYAKALKYYKDLERYDKNQKYNKTIFWIATMYKYKAAYDKAIKKFKNFKKHYSKKKDYYAKKAIQEIKSCKFAKKLIEDTVSFKVTNAGKGINTINPEFSPFLSDDSVLYYTGVHSKKIEGNEIISSKEYYKIKTFKATYNKKKQQWKRTGKIHKKINKTGYHVANVVLGPDNKKIFFSSCDKNHHCKIMVSHKTNDNWEEPQELNNNINKKGFTNTQPYPAIIQGQKILFFVSDRPKGKGKMDIWYSVKDNGKYGKPVNLNINTPDNEISPYYEPSNKTLYFSSDWHKGLGGMDIFKAKGSPLNLNEPINLGYPINSSVNDIYYKRFKNQKNGFFASNREGSFTSKSPTCCNDIYYFEWKEPVTSPAIAKTDSTDKTKKIAINNNVDKSNKSADKKPKSDNSMAPAEMVVNLYFHNDEPDPNTRKTSTSKNYIEVYKNYCNLEDQYVKKYTSTLDSNNKEKAEKKIRKFFKEKVKRGKIRLDSLAEIVLNSLEKGNDVELEVRGFCSPRTTSDYNVDLSHRRVSSIRNYFKEYNDSVFYPYIKGKKQAKLEIIEKQFGEHLADPDVNDELYNQRESIYSVKASKERRVEVKYEKKQKSDSANPAMNFEYLVHDFGYVNKGDQLIHSFKFTNNGNAPLVIKDFKTNAECEVMNYPKNPVPPGNKGIIKIKMDTKNLKGKVVGNIKVLTNIPKTKKEIHVIANLNEKHF